MTIQKCCYKCCINSKANRQCVNSLKYSTAKPKEMHTVDRTEERREKYEKKNGIALTTTPPLS